MPKFLCAALILAAGMHVGCQMDSETEVYVTDIDEVVESGGSLVTPVDFRIEVPSEDQCNDNKDEMEQMMEEHFPDFRARECKREDFHAYLQASARIPIVDSDSADGSTDQDSLLSLGVYELAGHGDTNKTYQVSLLLDRDSLARLNQHVQRQYHQDIDIAGSQAAFRINNDDRESRRISFQHAFVEGNAKLEGTISVERRDRVQLRLSDVSRSYLAENGYVPAFAINDLD